MEVTIHVLEKTDEQTKVLVNSKTAKPPATLWIENHKFEKPVAVGKSYAGTVNRGFYLINEFLGDSGDMEMDYEMIIHIRGKVRAVTQDDAEAIIVQMHDAKDHEYEISFS